MQSSIWYEKYKPSKVRDLVLPEPLKHKLQSYVDKQDIPNLGLFSNLGGTGKSSTAHAIIKEINGEALWVNASLERGIDVLRSKIQKFASASSFDDKIKIVVFDEFDNTSKDLQSAMRSFLDEFSANCRFIFTGNYPEKIIEPLLNRLEIYDFNEFSKKDMIKPIFDKLTFILDSEDVSYDQKDVAKIISKNYPSIRGMISDMQKLTHDQKLEFDDSMLNNSDVFENIMNSQTYMDMLKNVNSMSTPDVMYTYLYNNIDKYFNQESLQNVVITLAKYQEMNYNVRDKHLNLGACLTEIWKFKKV